MNDNIFFQSLLCTACKLNPDSKVGNTFIFNVRMILCHVTRPLTPPVYSSHKNKSVANLTVRIEFTYGKALEHTQGDTNGNTNWTYLTVKPTTLVTKR